MFSFFTKFHSLFSTEYSPDDTQGQFSTQNNQTDSFTKKSEIIFPKMLCMKYMYENLNEDFVRNLK